MQKSGYIAAAYVPFNKRENCGSLDVHFGRSPYRYYGCGVEPQGEANFGLESEMEAMK